jgi:hypothetical protein
VEFKRGIKDIESDVDEESTRAAPPRRLSDSDKRNLPGSEPGGQRVDQAERVGTSSRDDD